MPVQEVAKKLVELCNAGQYLQAVNSLYALDILSIEPMAHPPMPAELRGLEAVRGKNQWFMDNHDVHSAHAIGPFIKGDQFAVHFRLDATFKPTGKRIPMEEMALYTVANEKIVREEFFFLQP